MCKMLSDEFLDWFPSGMLLRSILSSGNDGGIFTVVVPRKQHDTHEGQYQDTAIEVMYL